MLHSNKTRSNIIKLYGHWKVSTIHNKCKTVSRSANNTKRIVIMHLHIHIWHKIRNYASTYSYLAQDSRLCIYMHILAQELWINFLKSTHTHTHNSQVHLYRDSDTSIVCGALYRGQSPDRRVPGTEGQPHRGQQTWGAMCSREGGRRAGAARHSTDSNPRSWGSLALAGLRQKDVWFMNEIWIVIVLLQVD